MKKSALASALAVAALAATPSAAGAQTPDLSGCRLPVPYIVNCTFDAAVWAVETAHWFVAGEPLQGGAQAVANEVIRTAQETLDDPVPTTR